jgi:hypothetical protein
MKNKAKTAYRKKKIDIQKTGGGVAEAEDLGAEILAVLNIIAGELEQLDMFCKPMHIIHPKFLFYFAEIEMEFCEDRVSTKDQEARYQFNLH